MEEDQSTDEAATQGELALDEEQVWASATGILDTGAWMQIDQISVCLTQEQTQTATILNQRVISCSVHVFEELTSPADAQAETALRENSSTIREETLEPTRDRRTTRDQNWTTIFQFPLRGLTVEDDLGLLSVSDSESL